MSRRSQLFSWTLLLAFVAGVGAQSKEQDRVWTLPGLTFEYTSAQYSGYLTVPSKNNLHYWSVLSGFELAVDISRVKVKVSKP